MFRPAARQGVSPSRVGVDHGRYASVLAFLLLRFPMVGDWRERLARGDVLDEQGRPLSAHAPCRPGMLIWYWRQPPPEAPVPVDVPVLHQCDHLVVVDKPHGLPVTPGGRHVQQTVLVRLKQQLGIDTLAPMHRLDRDTAGVLAFTVRPDERHAYQSLFRDRQVSKVYEAVAPWRDDLTLPHTHRSRLQERPGEAFMQMHEVPGEPNSETRIELIQRLPTSGPTGQALAHYRLLPLTGRKHQLRAHLCALGLPIVGDRIYPELLPDLPAGTNPHSVEPLQLLARELAFVDPVTGLARRFVSQGHLRWAQT